MVIIFISRWRKITSITSVTFYL